MNQDCYYFEDLREGLEARATRTVSESDVYLFCGITGDINPLHVDAEGAGRTRFRGRIVPGMLLGGLISAALGRHLPGCIYVSQQLTFLRPVRLGDTVHAFATVRELHPVKATVVFDTRAEVRSEAVAVGESTVIARRRAPVPANEPGHAGG